MSTAFLPSLHGFHFVNSFDSEEIMEEAVGAPSWMTPDSIWGLCGGMCFGALDRYFRGDVIPDADSPPAPGDPLFTELVARQMDTIDSVGLSKIVDYQSRPDEGRWRNFRHSLGYYVLTREWPAVRNKIRAGIPTTICLIRVGRADPDIGANHQVVAYNYTLSPSNEVEINVYDPNHPGDDNVVIGFTWGQENSRLDAFDSTGHDLRGFLRVPYDRTERVIEAETPAGAVDNLEWLWTVLE